MPLKKQLIKKHLWNTTIVIKLMFKSLIKDSKLKKGEENIVD